MVVCLEESTDDREDDDGEAGDNNAVTRLTYGQGRERAQVGAPCPGIEGGYDGLHCELRRAVVSAAVRGWAERVA